MNALQSGVFRKPRFFRTAFTTAIFAVTLFSLAPTPLHAGGARFFLGGRGFGGGLAFGLGVGIGRSLFYPGPRYYTQPNVYVYSSPPPVYYVQSPVPQIVTVVTAPPPPAVPVAAPSVPTIKSSSGKLSKILYDANAKPIGVLVLNLDGTQEFIPIAQ